MPFKLPPKTHSGFSLIELLVVISIIGLVTGVGASFVSSIQRNTRDAQREADLRVLQGALQQYYADNSFYPDTLNLTSSGEFHNCTNYTPPAGKTCTKSKVYLQNLPKDPVPGTTTPYCYRTQVSITNTNNCGAGASGLCHYYVLCANLENPSNPVSCSCGTGNFAVTPL